MNYLGLSAILVAIALCCWLAFAFADWNKQQACVTSGGRNCGTQRIMLTH